MTEPKTPNVVRDLTGYDRTPPQFAWPGGAQLAVNFVLNVEEGSEYAIEHGDGRSETALLEIRAPRVPVGERDLAAESMYEYGHRVGFWRIHDLFRDRDLPLTIFAAAKSLERTPSIAAAIGDSDWDICAHGLRWVEQYRVDPVAESTMIADAHTLLAELTGRAPKGWYCRYSRTAHTRDLVAAHGGYLYDSDAYNDEIPYWTSASGKPHLVVPYSLVTNDTKFLSGDCFDPDSFARLVIASIDVLASETHRAPRMISIGLHSRIIGHPGRFAALISVLDHLRDRDDVWVTGRADIAEFWTHSFPAPQGRE